MLTISTTLSTTTMSQRRRFKDNFDNNDDGDKNNANLVDADSLIFVGEIAGEKIQGGGRGIDLHCALGYFDDNKF